MIFFFGILHYKTQINATKEVKSIEEVIICVKQVNDLTYDSFRTIFCFQRLYGVVILDRRLQRVQQSVSAKSR